MLKFDLYEEVGIFNNKQLEIFKIYRHNRNKGYF